MKFREFSTDDIKTSPEFLKSLIDLHQAKESFKRAHEANCVLSINHIPLNEPLTLIIAKHRIRKINIPEICWRK